MPNFNIFFFFFSLHMLNCFPSSILCLTQNRRVQKPDLFCLILALMMHIQAVESLPEESAAVGMWVRPICYGGSGDRPWQTFCCYIPNSFFFFFFFMTETIQTWEIF